MSSVKKLRDQAGKLEGDLTTLTQAAQQLTAEADLMRRFENDLEVIALPQGHSIDNIVDLVIDNDMTLEKLKVILCF